MAAQEIAQTSKAMQHYIMGTSIRTVDDIDAFAGNIDTGGPPTHSTYAYPLGNTNWPKTYPVPPATLRAMAASSGFSFYQVTSAGLKPEPLVLLPSPLRSTDEASEE